MEDMPTYTGCVWGAYKGRSGWVHTWGDGTVLPVIRGGSGGQGQTDDDDDDDDDDDNTDDTGDDDDSGDDTDTDKDATDDTDDPVKKANAEAKRRRLQAREARQRAERAEAALEEIQNKDKPEVDRLKAENDNLKKELEKAREEGTSFKKDAVFARVAADLKIDNREYAQWLVGKEAPDLDPTDDGYEDDLHDALKAVIKKHPDVAPKQSTKRDDNGAGDLPSTGAAHNSQKGKGKGKSAQELANKYPALRR